MAVETEVPFLPVQLGAESVICPWSRAAVGDIAVLGIDDTVTGTVDKCILDGIAVLVINLLVEIVGERSIACLVD